MPARVFGLGVRLAILLTFAIFFVAPIVWLVLAPTKSDQALIVSSPFSFGDFHHVALAWKHLDAFSSHIYRRWIGNTLYYALTATAITLAVGVPAGYGLAVGRFPGRKLVLSLTLVVMIVPGAALVLPIFLELNAMRLIGSVLSVILPFSFFPFGVYLAYLYYATALPPGLLDAARVDGAGELQTFLRGRAPPREAGRRARLLLQLRRRLEQLLPAVRRAGRTRISTRSRSVSGICCRPHRRSIRRSAAGPVGQDLQARARARDADRRRAGRDRLRLLTASARPGSRRRSSEGVSHG